MQLRVSRSTALGSGVTSAGRVLAHCPLIVTLYPDGPAKERGLRKAGGARVTGPLAKPRQPLPLLSDGKNAGPNLALGA